MRCFFYGFFPEHTISRVFKHRHIKEKGSILFKFNQIERREEKNKPTIMTRFVFNEAGHWVKYVNVFMVKIE